MPVLKSPPGDIMVGSKGYLSLVSDVKRDTDNDKGTFNTEGCIQKCPGSHCFHKYCDKFKWVIDRANHYSNMSGIDATGILEKWENDRDYWYMNYYQECNQPKFEGDNIRIFDTVEEFKKSGIEKGFRCPHCNGISINPVTCNSGIKINGKICDWKAYGLFGTLGKGIFVFIKERLEGHTIFYPIAWESNEQEEKQ